MANAVITSVRSVDPTAEGARLTVEVTFVRESGTANPELVPFLYRAGDRPQDVERAMFEAVRARGTQLGYALPNNSVLSLLSTTKG